MTAPLEPTTLGEAFGKALSDVLGVSDGSVISLSHDFRFTLNGRHIQWQVSTQAPESEVGLNPPSHPGGNIDGGGTLIL